MNPRSSNTWKYILGLVIILGGVGFVLSSSLNTNLTFFSILLMLHLSSTELARQTVEKYKDRLPHLPKMEEQQILITRCENAVLVQSAAMGI